MPRHVNPPKTIEEQGLAFYLNEQAAIHNGYGYAEFVKRFELGEERSVMARAFNVSRPTIYNWVRLYRKLANTN